MKVLIVAGSYPPMKCGIGDYSSNLAKALAAVPKMQVGVLTSISDGEIDRSVGVKIFPIIKKWRLTELLKVIRIIRQWSPDITHIQYPTQGYGNGFLPWLLPMTFFLMRKKVVQTWHEGYSRWNAPMLFLISIVPGKLVVVRPRYKEMILHPLLRWALWKKETLLIQNASCISYADLGEQEKDLFKKRYLKKQRRLVVFFGFVYPHKGVELLFDIADPAIDQIVIAGEIDKKGDYFRKIMERASIGSWANKVTITGFLPNHDVAALLAVADAVILPFRDGGGEWNSSIHGTILNRAFLITTSLTRNGYDKIRNVYFSKVDDIQEMRKALLAYGGTRREYNVEIDRDQWQKIADEHCSLYENFLYEK